MKHFVYRLTLKKPFDERKYYVGKHSGEITDFETKKYKTSSRKIKPIFNNIDFDVKIIEIFKTAEEALRFEGKYHRRLNVATHKLFFNEQNQSLSGKIDRTGMMSVINNITNEKLTVSVKTYNNTNKLIAYNKNMILCKNEISGEQKIVSKEEFKNDKKLVGINKNIVHCRLKSTDEKITIQKKDFNSEIHIHSLSGITVYDKKLKKCRIVPKEEFQENDNLVGVKAFTKEKKKYCNICKKNIGASNYERHLKRHETRFIWITDNNNQNSYKVSEKDFYLTLKNDYYIIQKENGKTYGYVNGEKHNLRYVGKKNKNLKINV